MSDNSLFGFIQFIGFIPSNLAWTAYSTFRSDSLEFIVWSFGTVLFKYMYVCLEQENQCFNFF